MGSPIVDQHPTTRNNRRPPIHASTLRVENARATTAKPEAKPPATAQTTPANAQATTPQPCPTVAEVAVATASAGIELIPVVSPIKNAIGGVVRTVVGIVKRDDPDLIKNTAIANGAETAATVVVHVPGANLVAGAAAYEGSRAAMKKAGVPPEKIPPEHAVVWVFAFEKVNIALCRRDPPRMLFLCCHHSAQYERRLSSDLQSTPHLCSTDLWRRSRLVLVERLVHEYHWMA